MTIRRMTLADVPQVYDIEHASFAIPWTYQDMVKEMTDNPVARYLVAEEGGSIAGFVGAHIILDEGHIINIAVLESARQKGYGNALMQAIIQYAANLGAAYLTLEVRQSNESAIRLYQKHGFFKVHVRKRYYQDNGEDAWLMVLDRMPPAQEDFAEQETVTEEDTVETAGAQ